MSFLKDILNAKRVEIAAAKNRVPLSIVEDLALQRKDVRNFTAALNRPGIRIIAEIKRASPSLGDIALNLNPTLLGSAYEAGGAAALSVLTESAYFKGSIADLQQARAVCSLPVLRKDFIVEPYQVYETAAMGADAMLLIVRILDGAQLHDLLDLARHLGLHTLVEVHDETDVHRIANLHAPVVLINNRDLAHFQTDVTRAVRIAGQLPADTVVVAASGIRNATDVQQALTHGIRRFLIGKTLVKHPMPSALLHEWTGLPYPA